MQIPNPPTDNLYKFLSVFGLITLIFSTAAPLWTSYTLSLRIYQLQSEGDTLKIELDYLQRKIGQENSSDRFIAEQASNTKDLQIRTAQLSRKTEEIKFIREELEGWKIFIVVGMALGWSLIFIGFSLWYFRLQRYQDIILKNEAKKIEK
jgi:hypothetical protein